MCSDGEEYYKYFLSNDNEYSFCSSQNTINSCVGGVFTESFTTNTCQINYSMASELKSSPETRNCLYNNGGSCTTDYCCQYYNCSIPDDYSTHRFKLYENNSDQVIQGGRDDIDNVYGKCNPGFYYLWIIVNIYKNSVQIILMMPPLLVDVRLSQIQ